MGSKQKKTAIKKKEAIVKTHDNTGTFGRISRSTTETNKHTLLMHNAIYNIICIEIFMLYNERTPSHSMSRKWPQAPP